MIGHCLCEITASYQYGRCVLEKLPRRPALVAVASTEGPLKHPLRTSPDSPKSKRAFCYANRCFISQQNALWYVQGAAAPAVCCAKPATRNTGGETPDTPHGRRKGGGRGRESNCAEGAQPTAQRQLRETTYENCAHGRLRLQIDLQ